MGLTKDYLRYVPAGVCNVVGSANGAVEAVDRVTCAVSACENVNFYNMRTLEKAYQVKREGHTVTTFKFSKDRRLLAIGYDDGEVHLYDRAKGKDSDVVVFAGHRTGVNCLAFSHDGLTLASGGKDSVIILWDIVNESGVFRLNGHKGSVTQLQFSLDNKCLVSSSKDYTLKFWSLETQSCFYTIAECTSEIYTFALIKADRLLVVGSAELELRVFELTWLNRLDIKEEDDPVVEEKENEPAAKKTNLPSESFPGAEHLDEESAQGNTILRCRKRGALVRQAKGRALQISVSKDEALLCCVGGDALLDVYRIYDEAESRVRFQKKLRKAKKRAKEDGSSMAVNEAEISKDVTLLLSRIGDYRADAKVKWVDVCGAFKKLDEHTREYRLYVLHQNNSVHGVSVKVDWRSNAVEAASLVSLDKRGHRSDVRCLAIASNDAAFLSGAAESAILWDMSSLLPVNTLTDDAVKDITGALFVPGDKNVVLGTKDGSLFLFDLATCELVEASRKVHEGTIWDMVQLPDKKGFVSCGADKKARFWTYELVNDLSTKRLSIRIERMLELPDEALCCAISPNGKFIVFGLLDNTARVYYLDSLKFFVSLYGHSLPVTCVDVGPDNKLVVTGSADKSVKIWGLDFGDCHKSLFAHDDVVTCVKFNPGEEEKLFWSAGKDGKVRQWDAVKFDRIQTLNGHSAEVRALTRTADGNTLVIKRIL
ncbi:Protein F13H8.2 [Aphelenchoides avenae]|nr:Protein F13H8.2 [Aphelenchus avenae]